MIESLSSVPESVARRCLLIAHVIGWGVFALGLSVLAGWLFDLSILKSIIPGALGMKCNTAVCLLFGGLALSLDRPDSGRVAGNARTLLTGTVATIAFLTLFEYLSGHDLGIDQFLFRDPLPDSYPGRMSPATALAFAGFSLALLIRDRGDDGLILFQSLLLVPLTLGAFNLISYVLGLPALFRWGSGLTTMAIPTAAAFVALSVGVGLTRPTNGVIGMVASKRMGGTFARRALPIALLFPVLISWLRIKGELFGWYETQFGFLIVALSAVSIFSALILLSARRLNRHDEQLQQSNALLETNISERTAELELRVAQLREEIVLREAAEGARTQSDMRFHQAMEFAPIGMAIVSLEGRWIEVNRAVCDLVGYSHDALMNLTFQDITHPEDLDADLANVRQLLDGKIQTYQMEKRYFHKDGRLVWVLLSVSLVRSAKGDPLHFIAQIQDVTGRKEAERQRIESEARFRSLTALSADWYWEQDENFRFTLQSGGALGAVGISDQDALGKTRWELPYDNMTEADWNQHRVILDAHKPFHDLELVRELADGKKRYVSISGQPMLDEGGRFTGYRGIGRDISARRIAEIELENSKRFLSEVIDAIPVPLTVKDENRRLIIVNSANSRFHGCAAADFIGKLDTDLFPPDRARQIEAEDDAVLQTGEPMIEEQAFETVSGELRWIIKHKRRITLSDGRHWLIATLLDITKRRETEAALAERESWLRLVTDTSAACVGYIDTEQRFRFCNRTYLEWYGIEPADLLGKSIAEVVGEQYPRVQSHYRQVLLGQRASYERKLRRDGDERDIFVDLIPDIRDHGIVAGAFIYSSDITARVRGEQAVRESEELLRRTEQIARIGGWSLDVATATLTWSDEVYRIHELDPAQKPRFENVLEFYAPETRAVIDQAVQLGIEQGIPWNLELPFVTARGRTIWVRAQGSAQMLDGKTVKLYGTFQDITERKLAELALERSQTFLHAVVEGVPQPLFVKDSQHRWVLFNKAFCDLVEKQGSELLGHTDADVFPADHVRRVWAEDDEVLDGSGSLSVVETPVVRTDGASRWLLKSKKRVELSDGSTYIVGVSTDITTLKNTQEAYRRSEELHRAARRKFQRHDFTAGSPGQSRVRLAGLHRGSGLLDCGIDRARNRRPDPPGRPGSDGADVCPGGQGRRIGSRHLPAAEKQRRLGLGRDRVSRHPRRRLRPDPADNLGFPRRR